MKLKKILLGCGAVFITFGLIACTTNEGKDPLVEVVNYTVTFHYKNGYPSTAIQIQDGQKLTKPEEPEKSNYEFKGWYLDEDYNKAWNFDIDIVEENLNLYAKWEEIKTPPAPITYSVTYDMHGHGEIPTSITKTTTLPNPLPSIEDVEGWHFVGWYLDENYTILAQAGKDIKENTIIHAKWEKKQVTPPTPATYRVTYVINGHGTQPSNLREVSALPASLPNLTEEGWTFVGWYEDEDLTIAAEAGKALSKDTTLYAKWEEKQVTPPTPATYSVTYVINGHGTQPSNLTEASTLPSSLPSLTEEGWTFVGWYTDEDLTIVAEAGKALSKDTTLYAKWEEKQVTPPAPATYSVTYDMHGHGESPTSITKTTTLPNPLPSIEDVEGWHFVGWYLDENYTILAQAGKTIKEDIILHAKWLQNTYSVSYNINGYGEQPKGIDATPNLPNEFPQLSHSVKVFAGWYLDSNLTKKAEEGMVLTEDVTLYAKWIDKSTIVINEAAGYSEGAYLEWNALEECEDYNVYYKKENHSDTQYIKIDKQLIRKYPTYYRADIVGLSKGNYTIKVVPVYENVDEIDNGAQENVIVTAHDRSGFGFSKNSTFKTASGAYNDDGSLKSNAKVIYVSANNAKTVTCTLNGIEYTGLQAIIAGKQKGDTTPLAIRLLGLIKINHLDAYLSQEEGIQIKGKNAYSEMNLTIEGIGEDATCSGFGFLIRNCGNVEFRNFAIMNHLDDAVSIDTSNCNLWIHHLDLYYGAAGGDSDQAKGDGFIDIKKSQYCTVSYNHFYDSGKSCLIDASAASSGGSDYLTYHHNWFDHSDSRHPRVRNGKNIHIYNNYYDGVSKYGVGATTGSSTFVEANYFRNTKYPMMIAGQGSDIDPTNAKGTFSGETGGMIKAYNNKIVEGGTFISQIESPTDFDAVVVANKSDKVTNYSCKKGGGTYSNFDTDANIMYSYTPDAVDDVVEIVTSHAGRIHGGDFHWTFDNAKEDTNYSVIPELKQAILNYTSKLILVLGIEGTQSGGNTGGGETGGDTPGTGEDNPPAITDSIAHNFTIDGKESNVFSITGNLSTGKGTVEYKGLSLTQCLKMESATKIDFNTNESMVLVLVLVEANGTIKVDGSKYTAVNGIITVSLKAGTHSITKADGANLFYIELGK